MQIYTTFYCRINEPSYIKHLKLDILAAIADETNAYDIATELTEYVNDIDEKLARKAIKTVGQIALEVRPRKLFAGSLGMHIKAKGVLLCCKAACHATVNSSSQFANLMHLSLFCILICDTATAVHADAVYAGS